MQEKNLLVNYGFRMPSAYDNRPLTFDEFSERVNQVLYVSATPADYEVAMSAQVVEQIIRPTGLVDPEIIVKPITGQIDDLIGEIRAKTAKKIQGPCYNSYKKNGRRPHRISSRSRDQSKIHAF